MITAGEMMLCLGLWLSGLFLLWRWQDPHVSSRGRFGGTTYSPHISHSLSWLYFSLSTALAAVFFSISSNHPGPLLLLVFALGQFWYAIRLFIAWRRNEHFSH